jgi:hypothetical protein
MPNPPPLCESMQPWLRHHLWKGCLAPLTGQDFRALSAFVHLVELYAVSDDDGRNAALFAMAATALAMQEDVRHLAKSSIPHVLDWGDKARLWSKIEDLSEDRDVFRRLAVVFAEAGS